MSIDDAHDRPSRRQFIRNAAMASAALTVVPRHVLGGPGEEAPSEKLNIGGIGIGGVGKNFIKGCEAGGAEIVALCDIDQEYAKPIFELYPEARRYRDYREMLQTEKDIDGVIVATPDHTHAVIAMEAIRRGRHVMCVKPLGHTVHECRTLADAAREAKIATQVTCSSRASDSARQLVEMIWDGAIGPVREAHCWSNRPLWPQGMARPEGEDEVPAHLDWDLWIGPAPMRPFVAEWPEEHLAVQQVGAKRKAVYHPWNFRGWWDFGTGSLGDMGCHHFNTLFQALKLGHPTSVHASSSRLLPETAPLSAIVTWDFPAREDMPPLRLVWYDGGMKPSIPAELADVRDLPGSGNLYIGDKGKIIGGSDSGKIIPESKMKSYTPPPKTLRRPEVIGNIVCDEWLAACKGGEPASCNFEVGGLLAEVVILGNIAIRTGKRLDWDGENMRITNDEEANGYLQKEYRSGWSLG
jgi:predicted dehydrogenase